MTRITKAILAAALPAALALGGARADDTQITYHGAGWIAFGRIQESHAFPTDDQNYYRKNWLQNSGGQINADVAFGDGWDGGLGLGTIQVHLARGSITNANIWYPFWVPYVPEARISHASPLFSAADELKITLGAFPYDYNPDVKNLGLYLLRGYVYPGTLVSGFETKHVLPVASIFGGLASYQIGGIKNDLIVNAETDDKPLYDISVADVAGLKLAPGLEIGAGVNFYRALPQNRKLTSPGKGCNETLDLGPYANGCYIVENDAAGNPVDTVTGSLAGTKLMARFHFDPKPLLGLSGLGANDLVVYGEAALLGLKRYPVYYDKILRRVPAMLGFNVPAFGILSDLSLEVEYYASKNSSDNLGAQNGSWVPAPVLAISPARDDWKWSVYADRVLFGHMKFSAQVADDHLRLGGSHNDATGAEALNTLRDWYWMCKLAYFF